MFTDDGKEIIRRYLSKDINEWAANIALGVGDNTIDSSLGFEITRGEVDLISIDEDNIIVKANIPSSLEAEIHEVGLYSLEHPTGAGRIILNYDPQEIDITNSTLSSEFRVGNGAATPTSSSMVVDSISDNFIDFVDTHDLVVVCHNTSGSGQFSIRLRTNSVDYYSLSFSIEQTGYNILRAPLANVSQTGDGDLSDINSIETVIVSGTQSNFSFDAIRLESTQEFNNYKLVSRHILATPFVKTDSEMNVELNFGVI